MLWKIKESQSEDASYDVLLRRLGMPTLVVVTPPARLFPASLSNRFAIPSTLLNVEVPPVMEYVTNHLLKVEVISGAQHLHQGNKSMRWQSYFSLLVAPTIE